MGLAVRCRRLRLLVGTKLSPWADHVIEANVKGLRRKVSVAEIDVRVVCAADVQRFREQVLHPRKREHAVYKGDDATETLHVGAFTGPDLIAVATICQEPMPDSLSTTSWRLRGMATLDQFRGRSLGKRLAERCLAHAHSYGGTIVWCSARLAAVGFYRSVGLEQQGKPFPLPEYSDEQYILMTRAL